MRITILSIGTRGDFAPYLSLGLGLRDAGHDVVLATHAAFADTVRAESLDYSTIVGDPRLIAEAVLDSSTTIGRAQPLISAYRIGRIANRLMVGTARDGLIACQDADLIIASPLGAAPGYHLAERLHLPLIRAFYAPVSETRSYPMFPLPEALSRRGAFNLWSYRLGRQLIWLSVRRTMNRARREVLGLPPLSLRDPFGSMDRRHWPLLYGYSEAVCPRPEDWGDWVHVTGYWFPSDPAGWSPPDDLLAFLAAGPPPIFVGFGSMAHPMIQKITEQLTQAALNAGHRVIVAGGGEGMASGGNTADVMAIGDIPYGWLFPQMSAVIHHGGAGTTAQGLRAGRPTLVIPFLPDQVYWGRRVEQLGVGCPLLRPADVERTDLRCLIQDLVESPEMRRRAEDLGRRIRSEDGVGRAVQLIEKYGARQAARS